MDSISIGKSVVNNDLYGTLLDRSQQRRYCISFSMVSTTLDIAHCSTVFTFLDW